MAWRQLQKPTEHVSELLTRPDCSLEMLAQESEVREAFRQQKGDLITFLVPHMNEILEIGLEEKKSDDEQLQKMCVFFLTTSCPSFSAQLSSNQLFLGKLTSFLTTTPHFSPSAIAAFCGTLDNLVQESSGFVFKYFPEPDVFIKSFVQHLSLLPVSSCLRGWSEGITQATLEFFEKENVSSLVLKMLGQDPNVNASVLSILTEMTCMDLPNANLIQCLIEPESLQAFFEIAIGESNSLSLLSFNLILELSGCCDANDGVFPDEQSDAVFNFVYEHLTEICHYITKDAGFSTAKSRACEVIMDALTFVNQIPECVYGLLEVLWDRVFENPILSILHCSFLGLLSAIETKDKMIFKRIDMRQRIADAFKHRDTTVACYWGHLFKTAEMIVDAENQPDTPCADWDEYVDGVYESMRFITESEYGGPLPSLDSISSSSYGSSGDGADGDLFGRLKSNVTLDDDDEEEEEEEEDSSDGFESDEEGTDKITLIDISDYM